MKTKFKTETRRINLWSNPKFRDFVTDASFHLTLSKNQIRLLVELDQKKQNNTLPYLGGDHFITGYRALRAKGLIDDNGLTRAGMLTVGLLEESGLYNEILNHYKPTVETA
jgi:hypothetical protein